MQRLFSTVLQHGRRISGRQLTLSSTRLSKPVVCTSVTYDAPEQTGPLGAMRSLWTASSTGYKSTNWTASTMSSFRKQARLYSSAKVVVVPAMGDSITEGTIETWEKKPGDFVNVDEVVVTIETDKVSQQIRASEAGVIEEVFAEEGDPVAVDAQLYSIVPGEAPAGSSKEEAEPAQEAPKASEPSAPAAPSTPAAAPPTTPAAKAATPAAPSAMPAAQSGSTRTERRVPMNRMRKMIAQRLKDSQNTNAMLTTFNEIDMSNLIEMRSRYKEEFQEKHGVKLGFMSAFVKASACALVDQPVVNAVIDGDDTVFRDFVDISVAVATPKGLVVPVLRNVDDMSFADIEKTISALGTKARTNDISLEEMTGGTFTISNGGVFGSLMGTPIINPPQSAILGMHATNQLPRVVDGEIVARPIMVVALTYDHRLIDGKEAVTFLRKIKLLVEDPQRMLLE